MLLLANNNYYDIILALNSFLYKFQIIINPFLDNQQYILSLPLT